MRGYLVLILAILILGSLNGTALAGRSQEAPADTASAEAFEPLLTEFRNLYDSLRALGGISAEDRPFVEALRERVQVFRSDHPTFAKAVAMEYQLSKWLKDDESAEMLMEEMLEIMPANLELVLPQARQLRQKNEYARAIRLLSRFDAETLGTNSEAALLYANCLFAEHKFAEAITVLDAITEDELATNSFVRSQVQQRLRSCESHIELWSTEQALRQAEAEADDLPRIRITMEDGDVMEAELFENEAPNTVANFIKLADEGFFNGTTFHRVIANFMIQGGDPNTKPDGTGAAGTGTPGYYIADEQNGPEARMHFAGRLAMGKEPGRANSAGCQFYITHEPTPHLNGQHTVFGTLTGGLDIARSIQRDERIASIEVLRKRDHEYAPETIPVDGVEIPATPPTGEALDTGG